MKEFKLY